MTLLTVSNQGFTVHNHMCGINFLSHFRGAPQSLRQSGMTPGDGGRIADSARDRETQGEWVGSNRAKRRQSRNKSCRGDAEKNERIVRTQDCT